MWLTSLYMWGLVAKLGDMSVIMVVVVASADILTVSQSVRSAVGVSVVGVGATVSAVHVGRTDMKSKILFQTLNSYSLSRNIRAFLRSINLE